MEAESNMGYLHDETLASALSRRTIFFQSGAMNNGSSSSSSSQMIPMANYHGINGGSLSSSITSNNPRGMSQAVSSSGSFLGDSVAGLKHDTGLAVEWSVEEQYKLEEGLVKYADEPSIMRYTKIAATLHDKSVRDVALRCRWMTRKRRKPDSNAGKKVKDRKDNVELFTKANIPSAPSSNVAPYSFVMNPLDHNDRMPFEALSSTRHLLEQNRQVLDQISANLSEHKLQDNVNLFTRTTNNIAAVLNDMREMPGIMSKMPPLPVSINQELAKSLWHSRSKAMMFGSSSGIHLKRSHDLDGEYSR